MIKSKPIVFIDLKVYLQVEVLLAHLHFHP